MFWLVFFSNSLSPKMSWSCVVLLRVRFLPCLASKYYWSKTSWQAWQLWLLVLRVQTWWPTSRCHCSITDQKPTSTLLFLPVEFSLMPEAYTHPVFPTVLIMLEVAWTHALIIVICVQTFLGGIAFLKREVPTTEPDRSLPTLSHRCRKMFDTMQGVNEPLAYFYAWVCVLTS